MLRNCHLLHLVKKSGMWYNGSVIAYSVYRDRIGSQKQILPTLQ